ncbi:uncharacterized membrane protein At1g16860-like [Salvia miltiorrhiza]|uniref:uncharacterized membrane protein At1g16860-like n=1 Tax=Salvia miltiorrhiza TaxID=226208 RepID=UPI0025AD4676|nr:uncharacterized membrane protein At1g16860-like [Salvia miltiorrhiza]XP_057795000.1 uncharacterized membrane protein At1g16860-like [Salvia miltiorrhiza]
MGTRTGSHQLSSGLMVSGRPERRPKERPPRMASRPVIYTGGDVKTSGELGRMYGVDISAGENPPPQIPPRPPGAAARSGPKFPNSGPVSKLSSSSSFSGPVTPIQPTGLITSDQQDTPGSNRRSGQLDAAAVAPTPTSFKKANYASAVTSLGGQDKLGFRTSPVAMWVSLVVAVMSLMVVAFLIAAVKKAVILVVAVAALVPAVGILVWNFTYKNKGVLGFLRKYPDTELRNAVDGQYVKVTGVVTCGSLPLETSYQRVPRCVYVSSELLEYRGCGGEKANAKHRLFSWGCRDSEIYVADFYISDNKSGERAIVKTGYGAKVSPFVKQTVVVNAKEDKEGVSPNFQQWLSSRGLSSDNRLIHLKEGYIREGYTVSVLGVVRRHNNMFMIVPPTEPVSTGFRWRCCLFPTYIDGLILINNENDDIIPV